MTIQNERAFLDNIWDNKIYNGCFPGTKIQVGDADGIVERKGNILFIEYKSPGVILKYGQLELLRKLVALGGVTVFVVHGKPGKPESLQIFTLNKTYDIQPVCLESYLAFVSKWFNTVNSRTPYRGQAAVDDLKREINSLRRRVEEAANLIRGGLEVLDSIL